MRKEKKAQDEYKDTTPVIGTERRYTGHDTANTVDRQYSNNLITQNNKNRDKEERNEIRGERGV